MLLMIVNQSCVGKLKNEQMCISNENSVLKEFQNFQVRICMHVLLPNSLAENTFGVNFTIFFFVLESQGLFERRTIGGGQIIF